jgi:hypothetical protein
VQLSVVIPVWSGTPLLIDMERKLIDSVRSMCDELIVCEDGPYCQEIADACDFYVTRPPGVRLGHPANLSSGVAYARSEYLGVLDFDVEIVRGSLREMCIPGFFVSAKLLPAPDRRTGFIIWCSVTPKELFMRFPLPTTGELLDDWADTIPRNLRLDSDRVEYEHHTGIGYSEWQKVHGT